LSGYLIAQGIMLSAAYFVSAGLETGLPRQVGYLGFIPIGLGLYALVGRYLGTESTAAEQVSKSHVLAIVALFLSVSFDSFAVFTPLLADSGPGYTMPILLGAAISAVAPWQWAARYWPLWPLRGSLGSSGWSGWRRL